MDPAVHGTLEEVRALLRAGKIPVEVFLTHRWTLDQAPEAFREVLAGNVIKDLVTME